MFSKNISGRAFGTLFLKWHRPKISSFYIRLKLEQFIVQLDRTLHAKIEVHRTISWRMRESEIFDYNLRTVGFECLYHRTIRKLLLYQVVRFEFLRTFCNK